MMIHIDRGGERMGPYSLEDVNRYLADGTLRPSDLGWYDGAANWVPVTNIEGVVAAGGAVPPPTPGASGSTCPNCQAPVETTQIVCMGCGTRLKEAPAAAKSSKKALFISLGVAGVIMLAVGSYFSFMGDGEADKSEKENTADKSKPKGKTPVKLAEFIKDKRIYVDMPIDPPAEKPFAQFNADGTFQVGAFVNGIASTSGKPDEKGKFSVSELTMTMFDDDGGEDSVVFSKAEPAKGDKISIIDEDGEKMDVTIVKVEAANPIGVASAAPGGTGNGGQAMDIFNALKPGNEEALKKLITSGADLNVKGPLGTPLIVSAIYGHTASAKLLINGGADVNAPAPDGNTALHSAAFFCHSEIVDALLAKGANVNAQNLKGETPLSSFALPWQVAQGIYQLFGGLLQMPMDQAELERIRNTRPQIAQVLRGAGGASKPAGNPSSASLQDAIFNEDLAAVKKFIAGGADVNAPKPDDGSTPLHTAAFVCNIEIVKVLIAAKANVNAKNKKGETPLLAVAAPWEAMPGIYGFFGALLQKKFDLERIQKDRVKVAEILRAAGAQ